MAESPYTLQWAATFFPLKIGDLDPHIIRQFLGPAPSPHPKWHLNWSSHFCMAEDWDTLTDRQDKPTDHAALSVTIGLS